MDESSLRTMVVQNSMPKATEIGQFLYAADGDNLNFTPHKPLVNNDGIILVDENDRIIVV